MNHLLFVILENKTETEEIIHELSHHGINGTILSSTSIKNFMHDEEEEDSLSFFSLAHLSETKFVHNVTMYFLLDSQKVEEVKQTIRNITKNFTVVKGGMFTTPLDSFEGSF